MACYLRSRDDDTKPARLYSMIALKTQRMRRVKNLVCSRNFLPTHYLQRWVMFLIFWSIFYHSAAHWAYSVYSVFLQVCPPGPGLYNCITILSLANSVWIPRMLNEGVSRLMVSVGRLRGREGVELWQHWQNMTRLQSWGHTAQRQILLMTERSRWQNTYDETIEATWRNLLCS